MPNQMQVFVQSVRNKAIQHKGAYIPYSQCLQPTKMLIESMNATKEGICLALSAKWIAEHANDGSLWNWLFASGTTNVKQSAIANLMVNFHDSVKTSGSLRNPTLDAYSHKSGFSHQDIFLDKYLGMYGVKRRSITQDLITGWQSRPYGVAVGQQLAARLSPKWMNTMSGAYVHIATFGKGGHSTCAFVGSKDICFFDPNFGEFYFTNQGQFVKFFTDFWSTSGYISTFNSFKLDAFAKGI